MRIDHDFDMNVLYFVLNTCHNQMVYKLNGDMIYSKSNFTYEVMMCSAPLYLKSFVFLALFYFVRVQSDCQKNPLSLGCATSSIFGLITNPLGILQDPITRTLCRLRTVVEFGKTNYIKFGFWKVNQLKLKTKTGWIDQILWLRIWRAFCNYRGWLHFESFPLQFKEPIKEC